MSQNKQTILFLASWYPTPQNKNHGIFIKNHALALSNLMPVIVVYAYSTSATEDFRITKNRQGKTYNLNKVFIIEKSGAMM